MDILKYFRKPFLTLLISLLAGNILIAQNDGSRYALNSVLSEGDWFKIEIPSTGIYKLTYEDLIAIGLKNPKDVQIYGYGGAILDEDFRKPYVDDLPQISLWMSDANDFGPGDYVLFYAKGDIKWTYSTLLGEFEHTQNPYSSKSFYFVTEKATNKNLVQSQIPNNSATSYATTFDDYALYENDLVSIMESGRKFYGENFITSPSQTFNLILPNVEGSTRVRYEFIARPDKNPASIGVYVNNVLIKTTAIPLLTSSERYNLANTVVDLFTKSYYNDTLAIRIDYNKGAVSDKNAHLDYIRVNYKRLLKPVGAFTFFRQRITTSNFGFRILDVTDNTIVWDVSDGGAIKKIEAHRLGSELSFSAPSTPTKEYALIDLAGNFPKPILKGKINNQNLHSLSPDVDILIIVQPLLRQYADKLAQVHLKYDNLTSCVVTAEDIYNEFSSGKPDATAIRRFAKMFYDRMQTQDPNNKNPRYLLLFGDGTFDNKFLTQEWTKTDNSTMLPTFQSVNSLSETASYTTDDYFGFLDDTEGASLATARLDIGIGRLPVRTESEANVVVSKLEEYIKNTDRGIWQNNITFIADDAVAGSSPASSELEHITNTDRYTETIKISHPDVVVNKIYEDAYERQVTPMGNTYPEAQKAIVNSLNKGTLLLHYMGHGSPTDWAHEFLLRYGQISSLSNKTLPLWITASCDFSRFDVSVVSGGEMTLLQPNGGAIGLFSTSRLVYSANNNLMAESLFAHMFDQDNGKSLRLGDIMRRAKNEQKLSSDDNKLRFMLLGDPALKLNYPDKDYQVKLTSINGQTLGEADIDIQALSSVVIKGEIRDNQEALVSSFNGTLESIILDNEQKLKTRGYKNSNVVESTVVDYNDYTNTIYRGKTIVKDGKFEISFIVPKDVLYSGDKGKMSFYAYNNDASIEASGYFTQYKVAGSSETAIPEKILPVISGLYIDYTTFKPGDKVSSTPLLYADLSDNSGINLSGLFGHSISLLVDGAIEYDLSSSFTSTAPDAAKGYIKYQMPQLAQGSHTLQLKVWDVWNNLQTQSVNFVVGAEEKTRYNFSLNNNLVEDNVQFLFTSNMGANIKMDIKYEIYSQNEILVWKHEEKNKGNILDNYIYTWNMLGNDGKRIKSGVYDCKITMNINGVEDIRTEKITVLGQ